MREVGGYFSSPKAEMPWEMVVSAAAGSARARRKGTRRRRAAWVIGVSRIAFRSRGR
jgi:hypothetical protein